LSKEIAVPSNRPKVTLRRATVAMLALAWQADRRRTVLAFAALTLQAIVQTLFAYWLKLLIDTVGADTGERTSAVLVAAAGVVGSIAGTAALAHIGSRVLATIENDLRYRLNRQALEVAGRVPTLELHENPEHLAQLESFRREQYELYQVVPRLVGLLAMIVRVVAAGVLLAGVHPLLLLLPLFGIPALAVSPWTGGLFRVGNERAAEPARRAAHLLELTATGGAAKEVRLFRLGGELISRFHSEQRLIRRIHHRMWLRAAGIGIGARMIFLVGYFLAIGWTVRLAVEGSASVGDAVLTAVLAGQVLGLVTGSAELVQLAFQSLVAASRLVYLTDLERSSRTHIATAPAPARLDHGIRFDHVSYCYPGTDRVVVADLDLFLPAGSTVAIVGDNGAGKSTVVKLLAGMYRPTTGRILLDHADLATIDLDRFRDRISACFQDHARFEFLVRDTVGIGNLEVLGDHDRRDQAVEHALDRAGATDLRTALPNGLETQLGPTWPGGIDLSGGQWQKLSLARAMMQPGPLVLLLDEPAAALDAETEHQLFGRWAEASGRTAARTGGVTILVSHRFSTVQMADLVVVLDQGRLMEVGTHAELLAVGGHYAEMYDLQARSYR
jgi:ATP-binding cassette subfamily B protein